MYGHAEGKVAVTDLLQSKKIATHFSFYQSDSNQLKHLCNQSTHK